MQAFKLLLFGCYFNDCLLGKCAFYLILFDFQNEKPSNPSYTSCCAAEINRLYLESLTGFGYFLAMLSILSSQDNCFTFEYSSPPWVLQITSGADWFGAAFLLLTRLKYEVVQKLKDLASCSFEHIPSHAFSLSVGWLRCGVLLFD